MASYSVSSAVSARVPAVASPLRRASKAWRPVAPARAASENGLANNAAIEVNVVERASPATASSSSSSTTSYRVSVWDAMRFNGPAPELVNGRLAMVGFLSGAIAEARTGETLISQAQHLSPAAALALAAVVYGSMVPVLKGAKNEPFGMFTPAAERLNGRAAMLAVAVLLALEYKSGVSFF